MVVGEIENERNRNEGRLDDGSGEGEEGQDLGERRWQVEVYEELCVGVNRNVEV